MARLTYAALALALAALVSGFFVRDSAAPLFASIGLSALVLLLILRGWARRIRTLRRGGGGEDEPIDMVDLQTSEISLVDDDDEEFASRPAQRRSKRKPPVAASRPTVEPRPRPAATRELRSRPATARAARRPTPGGVIVLPGRTRYHAPGCRFASGKGAQQISEATARRRRYEPCSVCLGE